MSSPIAEIRDLTKDYGTVQALRGVSLSIESGGIVGILGPNGAGKTTLVETIEGLRTPSQGRVSVLGIDPSREPRRLAERLGVQLQATELPPDLTVLETLRLFRAFYEKSLPANEVLAAIDLTEKSNARNRTLSGGQKQRLAIGLALVTDPELIILDEPTTGLDPAARRDLHKIIRSLKERGRTVLLTTHYIEEAEILCDRVVVMREGKVVADGSPFELLQRAQGGSTVWIRVDKELDPVGLFRAGAQPTGREDDYYRFTTEDPAAFVVALGRTLQEGNLTLLDLRMKRPTLEDVYLELVGTRSEDGDGEGS